MKRKAPVVFVCAFLRTGAQGLAQTADLVLINGHINHGR